MMETVKLPIIHDENSDKEIFLAQKRQFGIF